MVAIQYRVKRVKFRKRKMNGEMKKKKKQKRVGKSTGVVK